MVASQTHMAESEHEESMSQPVSSQECDDQSVAVDAEKGTWEA